MRSRIAILRRPCWVLVVSGLSSVLSSMLLPEVELLEFDFRLAEVPLLLLGGFLSFALSLARGAIGLNVFLRH